MTAKSGNHSRGSRFDLARFGYLRAWTGSSPEEIRAWDIAPNEDGLLSFAHDPQSGSWSLGLEWEEPREVRELAARFATTIPGDLQVQYWRHSWPTPAPERRPGARRGWIGVDDPWHGGWTTALGVAAIHGDLWTFAFDPLDLVELGRAAADQLLEAEDYLAIFRKTLRIRLVSPQVEPPCVTKLSAYSGSAWREGAIDLHLGAAGAQGHHWSGHAEAYNGEILALEPLVFGSGDRVQPDGRWICQPDGQPKSFRLHIRYTDVPAESPDRTLVTVRTDARSFTFLVPDLGCGAVCIPDYDVCVHWADHDSAQEPVARSIYARVTDEPEQSLQRAMAEMPPLDVTKQAPYGRYLPLGLDGGRQEFAVRYNGELFADKRLLKLKGRDAARLLWPGHRLRFLFGSGDPPSFRMGRDETRQRLLDGWLPVVISEWEDREILYEQMVCVAPLCGAMPPLASMRGDEDVVAMLRFRVRNTTADVKTAQLWIASAPQEQLSLQKGLALARGRVVPAAPVERQWRVDAYDRPYLRAAIDTGGRGALRAAPLAIEDQGTQALDTTLLYTVDLAGGESHELSLAIPFAALTEEAEWARAASLSFEDKLAEVAAYWREWVQAGAQFDLPERLLADLQRAVPAHIAIGVDKDPGTGLCTVPAATYAYGACGNEACWQITMLDQAGHHERAATYLETFLRTQGMKRPDGRFGSAEGALQGMDIEGADPCGAPMVSETFAYNLDHGVIMECLADHYRYSGDRDWLAHAAPYMIAAADWIIRERRRTMQLDREGRLVKEWGLLPAGHLEDNQEWRHWFAVNAHAYRGMRDIADVLADIDGVQSESLWDEAQAYRRDIRRAALRAMAETPVVRLPDGSYVPHIPSHAHLRGRGRGWFREAAYGALHLLEGDVFDPDEPEMTWLLQDLEDNLFVSREWGRPVDLERFWFSQGGVTIQANLMDLAIDYLRRGQIEHGLRSLFNNLAASLYPEVRTFTEHPVVALGHGVGPFYKASDEAKALTWLRAYLLRETQDALLIAPGAPRAWYAPGQCFGVQRAATFFGPMSYRIASEAQEISVEIKPPQRKPPAELRLHLRRPDRASIRQVEVNGAPIQTFSGEIVRLPGGGRSLVVRVRY